MLWTSHTKQMGSCKGRLGSAVVITLRGSILVSSSSQALCPKGSTTFKTAPQAEASSWKTRAWESTGRSSYYTTDLEMRQSLILHYLSRSNLISGLLKVGAFPSSGQRWDDSQMQQYCPWRLSRETTSQEYRGNGKGQRNKPSPMTSREKKTPDYI